MWDSKTEIKLDIFGSYGFKIQKVSRYRPTVSNENILSKRK